MKYNNFWYTEDESLNDVKRTDNIFDIMQEQSKYLYQDTEGRVFAVFGEIKVNGSIVATVQSFSNILKGISGTPALEESIDGISTGNLIDVNGMYFKKQYGFEICADKYRFRLFSLSMTPVYPVSISIDEEICKHIENELKKIAIPLERFNQFEISDEEVFCSVLKKILQDRKVRYIISELNRQVSDVNNSKLQKLVNKIIICEGRIDELILQAIAQKINKKVWIYTADGKSHLPVAFNAVNRKNSESKILILVDSDGNEEETRKRIAENIESDNYKLVVVNNQIEDWFMPEVKNYGKLKLWQSIEEIVDNLDIDELSKTNESFAQVIDFLMSS